MNGVSDVDEFITPFIQELELLEMVFYRGLLNSSSFMYIPMSHNVITSWL